MPQAQQPGIWTSSVTYTTAHGNAGSLTHQVRPGIKPTTSSMLVGSITLWATTETPQIYVIQVLGDMEDFIRKWKCKGVVNPKPFYTKFDEKWKFVEKSIGAKGRQLGKQHGLMCMFLSQSLPSRCGRSFPWDWGRVPPMRVSQPTSREMEEVREFFLHLLFLKFL